MQAVSTTYLGSTIFNSTKIDDELGRRISKTSQAFGGLQKHRLESSWSPPQHQTEDVQSGHSADAAAWSGDLDGVQEASAETQALPPQLSSADTKAEVAGPGPGHGHTGQ
ncbi:hypothetical protein SprV_0200722600 [Sparganum proliferum]